MVIIKTVSVTVKHTFSMNEFMPYYQDYVSTTLYLVNSSETMKDLPILSFDEWFDTMHEENQLVDMIAECVAVDRSKDISYEIIE